MVWHISAKETVNFKQSTFFVYKSNMPKNVRIHATGEGTRASNQDHLTEQHRRNHETGHSGAFARLEAQDNFWEHCGKDKSSDECGTNTKKQVLQVVEWSSKDSHSILSSPNT
jgi:hypothetical protein